MRPRAGQGSLLEYARAVIARPGLAALVLLGLGCGPSPTSTQPSETAPIGGASGATDPGAPSASVATRGTPSADAARRAPDLGWDSAVGWERRIVFPAGVTSVHRREWVDYASLGYLPWDDPAQVIRLLGTMPDLGSIALVLPHERLCEASLREGLGRAAPARLLVRLEGDPTAAEWDCLQGLGAFDLYLTLCPDDSPSIWRCDADGQLDALAARPALVERIRGLAVGPGEARHWATLAGFPRLSMLTVRGPIVRTPLPVEVQEALCALPELAYVDLLDASQPGSDPRLPVACALGLETYEAWRLLDGDPEWGRAATPVPDAVPCRLRRAMLWSADEAERRVLSRCEGLALELVRPE